MKLGFVLSFIALHHYDLFTGEEYFTLQLRREKIPKFEFDHSSCPDLKRYLFNQQLYFYYACYDLIME